MGLLSPFGKRGRRRYRWLWRLLPLLVVLAVPFSVAGLLRPFAGDAGWNMRGLAETASGRHISSWLDRIGSLLPWQERSRHSTGMRGITVVKGRARVIDGDSLRVKGVEVRLHGIDAPELRQTCRDSRGRRYACGRMARAHLQRLLAGRMVTCRRVTTDRYGRMVAVCTANGEDIGRRMVRDGWAVAFVRYSRHYVSDERAARLARRGLWQGRFVPPSQWRRTHARYP